MFYYCGNIWHVWEVFIFLHEVSVICMIVEVYDICVNYSCSCIISLHHVHSCYEHMHQARSVRKSYNYSGVLLS